MNEMNIKSAKYVETDGGDSVSIFIVNDDVEMSVPLDPANRHYAEIMRQVEAGELVIEPADNPE